MLNVVPSTLKQSFSFLESQSDSLSSFIKTCNRRASHVYTYVASEPAIPTRGIPRTLDIFSIPASNGFVALELTAIAKLAGSYGRSSEQYKLATDTLRASIDAVLAGSPCAKYPEKESSALSSCFSSLLACTGSTNDYSGHGQCTNTTRAGQECFVCVYTTTISAAGKIQNWAGEMCERKDVSG
ncbi:hypothetical protein HD554DRAFT_2312059 [Boletus coccyginus]|nr:hypothetical protein HD554DRAFT_2312059 [Boletus coccyginus]